MKTLKQVMVFSILLALIIVLTAGVFSSLGTAALAQQAGSSKGKSELESDLRLPPPSIRPGATSSSVVLINDGSFENSPSAWTEVDSTGCLSWIGDWSSLFPISAYDGFQTFWGGGVCGPVGQQLANSNSAEQVVSVPNENYILSFQYYLERIDLDGATNDDYAYVMIDDVVVWRIDLVQENNTGEWVEATINLVEYASTTVSLKFGVVNGVEAGVGNALFDHVGFLVPDTTVVTIDPELGGTLEYADPQGLLTTVVVPPGAVTETIALAFTPRLEPGPAFPPNLIYANHAFDLDAKPELLYLPALLSSSSLASSIDTAPALNTTSGTTAATGGQDSFTFLLPVTVTVTYSDADIVGIDEANLRLYYWNGSEWVDALTTCPNGRYTSNPQLNTVVLPVCHLSRFAMGG